MTRVNFWKLCDRARGELLITSVPRSSRTYSRRVLFLRCEQGFENGQLQPASLALALVSFKRFEETHAKYQDWLEQWREKKAK